MTHDVDADGRPAQLRPVRNHTTTGAFTPERPHRPVPADQENPAEIRLRALQQAGRPPHPARPGQAVQGAVPLAALAGAAPGPRRPDAGRRATAHAGPARLAAAAGALDRTRLSRLRLP